MVSRLVFVAEVTTFATVSAIINEGDGGHVLSIELFRGNKIVFRGEDISALHKALRQCDDAFVVLGRAARYIGGWNEAETESEPDEGEKALTFTDVEHNVLLTMAAAGITLRLGDPGFLALFNAGFIQVTDESMSRPTANREYAITTRGRARLAAQAPEVESAVTHDVLCDAAFSILGHLVDGGTLSRNNSTGSYCIEREDTGDTAVVDHTRVKRLLDQGLIAEALSSPCSPESLTIYVITILGRRVLAEREADEKLRKGRKAKKLSGGRAVDGVRGV